MCRGIPGRKAFLTARGKGVLGVFFEMGMAFLLGSAVNLSMQKLIPWFEEQFPGLDVYALINTFLWTMIVALLVLAVVRPLLLLRKRQAS